MQLTIPELKAKHLRLKKLDGGGFLRKARYNVFGASSHQYKLNECATNEAVQAFEEKHGITLPTDYRNFLLQIGNGGSGPAYGLFPLAKWAYDLELTSNNFLCTPFPHTESWNLRGDSPTDDDDYTETKEFQDWEQEYFSNNHITGSIRICHYGCAIYYLLVITGPEANNIWIDDRANDGGIYPALSKFEKTKMRFIEWYDNWLSDNLSPIGKK